MQPPIQPPTTEKKSGTASEPRTDVVLIADAQDPLVIGAGAEAVRSGAARATRAWKQADRAGHRRDLELDLLWTLALEIGAANDLQSALTVALESVCAATGWAMGEAWLPDDAAGVVHRDAVWIGDARRLQEFHAGSRQTVLARGEGLPGRVWASGTDLWLPDVTTDETFARATLAKEAGLHAAVGIPVLADEQVVAVLVFFHFETRNEERRLVDLTSAVAAQLGAVVQRKRIEDAYRRLEQRYETLLDHIPDSAWIKDEEGRYLAANHAFSEACGVPREKIVGRTDHDLFPTEVAERFWRDDRRVAEAGQRLTLEERVPWADGAEHWLETVKTPLRGDRGIVGTVGIARDVTERHRSEERERLLADAGRVLGSSLDREEVIQRVCGVVVPRLADWCVITLRESSGQSRVVQVAAADPDKNTAIRRMLEQGPAPRGSQGHPVDSVFGGGEALLFSRLSRADLSAIAPDEEHTALLDALNPRSAMTVPLLAQGRVLGAMVLAASESGRHYDERDLALAEELGRRVALGIENARLYAAERTARAQAEAAMRARDEVLGIVAHDLRNPVGAISLCAAVLRDVVASEVGKEKHLDAILHAAGQMERLIQDLLEVSRIEAGRLSIDPEWVRPACLLEEAVRVHEQAAEHAGLRLTWEEAPDLPAVWADHHRVLQVLSNLVGNAIKFTPSGGRILLRAEQEEDSIRFSVADTGSGIASAERPYLFDRFWQARRSRKGGAGLGLAIVKGLVEAHGGEVGVKSRAGEGSVFSFVLPGTKHVEAVASEAPTEIGGPGADEPTEEEVSTHPVIRVLLADDHSMIRRGVDELLKSVPEVEVVGEAATGEEAVQRVRELRPDVVVMDLAMPGMGGIEATRTIVAQFPEVRVLALAASTEAEGLLPILEAGGHGFVSKTNAHKDLPEALRMVMAGQMFLHPSGLRLLRRRSRHTVEEHDGDSLESLSEQDRQILSLVAQGYTSREIGERLSMSSRAVYSQRSELMKRLGLNHRSDLVHFTLRTELLAADA